MTASHACPTCGHQNRWGAKFCQKCGAHLDGPGVSPIDQTTGGAPPVASTNTHMPTLPLPKRSSAAPVGKPVSPLTGKAKVTGNTPVGPPLPTQASAEIAKTLMLKAKPLPPIAATAADYQLGPPLPAHAALPGWFWLLIGLLTGILLTVVVLHYGPGLLEFFW